MHHLRRNFLHYHTRIFRDQHEALIDIARREGTTVSALLRVAIDKLLAARRRGADDQRT